MWCDLGESVGSRTCDIISFLFDWSPHQERYILLKISPESDEWFQSYSNWKIIKTIENKRNAFLFLAVSPIDAPDFRLTSLDHNTYDDYHHHYFPNNHNRLVERVIRHSLLVRWSSCDRRTPNELVLWQWAINGGISTSNSKPNLASNHLLPLELCSYSTSTQLHYWYIDHFYCNSMQRTAPLVKT